MPGKVPQIEEQNIVVSLGIRGVKIKEIIFFSMRVFIVENCFEKIVCHCLSRGILPF